MEPGNAVRNALEEYARAHGIDPAWGMQTEAAKALGVTRQTIRNWVLSESVSLKKVEAFARLTGAHPEDLNADLRRIRGRAK